MRKELRGRCLPCAGRRRRGLQEGNSPGAKPETTLSSGAPLPPANSRMRSAASARGLGQSTIREPRTQPQPIDFAHARRHLGPRPGRGCRSRAPLPALARRPAHARRRVGSRLGRGCRPRGYSSPKPGAESSGGGDGVGRGDSPLGRSESGRLLAWLPPRATSYAIPYVLTTTQARATSAPPPRSPLLPAAAMSWRLPLKQPGLGGTRSGDRPGRERGGVRARREGRGGGRATAPRPSSPLPPAAPWRPRPFLADSLGSDQTPRTGH